MDALKLLGDLLGGQQLPSQSGRRVLAKSNPALRRTPGVRSSASNILKGVLGAAANQYGLRSKTIHRTAQRGQPAYQPAPQRRASRPRAHGHGHGYRAAGGYAPPVRVTGPGGFGASGYSRQAANQRAELLIRAMISAAKADGRVCPEEEQRLMDQFGRRFTPAELHFIRQELARPIDVCALARDTPRGMEDEVYTASLIAITLDTHAEAQYLHDLARELRLPPDHCNLLHHRCGVRGVF